MSEYYAGKDCTCYAEYKFECICGADWTEAEVYELRERVEKLEVVLEKLKRIGGLGLHKFIGDTLRDNDL